MTASGPSRHFAAAQQFGRFLSEADIRWHAGLAGSVANDPFRTSASPEESDGARPSPSRVLAVPYAPADLDGEIKVPDVSPETRREQR
jgi:hypothetical protein